KRGNGGKNWSFSQSGLFLDFLAGNQTYRCTPWGNPTRTVFGWQKPCYLLGEGYAKTFKELMEDTNWDTYGVGNYEKCAQCMVHSGFEATAVQTPFAIRSRRWFRACAASTPNARWRPTFRSTGNVQPSSCSRAMSSRSWTIFAKARRRKRGLRGLQSMSPASHRCIDRRPRQRPEL